MRVVGSVDAEAVAIGAVVATACSPDGQTCVELKASKPSRTAIISRGELMEWHVEDGWTLRDGVARVRADPTFRGDIGMDRAPFRWNDAPSFSESGVWDVFLPMGGDAAFVPSADMARDADGSGRVRISIPGAAAAAAADAAAAAARVAPCVLVVSTWNSEIPTAVSCWARAACDSSAEIQVRIIHLDGSGSFSVSSAPRNTDLRIRDCAEDGSQLMSPDQCTRGRKAIEVSILRGSADAAATIDLYGICPPGVTCVVPRTSIASFGAAPEKAEQLIASAIGLGIKRHSACEWGSVKFPFSFLAKAMAGNMHVHIESTEAVEETVFIQSENTQSRIRITRRPSKLDTVDIDFSSVSAHYQRARFTSKSISPNIMKLQNAAMHYRPCLLRVVEPPKNSFGIGLLFPDDSIVPFSKLDIACKQTTKRAFVIDEACAGEPWRAECADIAMCASAADRKWSHRRSSACAICIRIADIGADSLIGPDKVAGYPTEGFVPLLVDRASKPVAPHAPTELGRDPKRPRTE
jgi:hypothetical protein